MPAAGVQFIAGSLAAILFAEYLNTGYNIMSATNSSPQTTELFAGDRADTLWKYVKLGDLQIAGAGLFGTMLARNPWPAVGAGTAIIVMHAMYRHALKAGTAAKGKQPDGRPAMMGLAW